MNKNNPDLGYDPQLGYDYTDFADEGDAGPAGPNLSSAEQADLEPYYRAVVAEQEYDPEERGKVIFAEFAIGPNRGRVQQ